MLEMVTWTRVVAVKTEMNFGGDKFLEGGTYRTWLHIQ